MKKMFTFNELIIVAVITVIGFCSIAAITENAAKKSSLAICADNMKKIAQAATQYAHDNNNTLPGTTYKVGVNWQLRIAPYLGYKNIKPCWREMLIRFSVALMTKVKSPHGYGQILISGN